MPDMPAKNTDRELYREPIGDLPSEHYANSLHVTEQGTIGMNVGGFVITKSIEDWHTLAVEEIVRTEACRCEPGGPNVCGYCFARSRLDIPKPDARGQDALARLLQSADVHRYVRTSVWQQYAAIILAAGWQPPNGEGTDAR